MRIERATEQDLEGIIDIIKAVDLPHKTYSDQSRMKDAVGSGLVYISKDGQVDGVLCLKESYDLMLIDALAVREAVRREGIGKGLVEFAIRLARERGDTTVEVGSHKMFDAKGFYLKCGFEMEADYGDAYLFSMQL